MDVQVLLVFALAGRLVNSQLTTSPASKVTATSSSSAVVPVPVSTTAAIFVPTPTVHLTTSTTTAGQTSTSYPKTSTPITSVYPSTTGSQTENFSTTSTAVHLTSTSTQPTSGTPPTATATNTTTPAPPTTNTPTPVPPTTNTPTPVPPTTNTPTPVPPTTNTTTPAPPTTNTTTPAPPTTNTPTPVPPTTNTPTPVPPTTNTTTPAPPTTNTTTPAPPTTNTTTPAPPTTNTPTPVPPTTNTPTPVPPTTNTTTPAPPTTNTTTPVPPTTNTPTPVPPTTNTPTPVPPTTNTPTPAPPTTNTTTPAPPTTNTPTPVPPTTNTPTPVPPTTNTTTPAPPTTNTTTPAPPTTNTTTPVPPTTNTPTPVPPTTNTTTPAPPTTNTTTPAPPTTNTPTPVPPTTNTPTPVPPTTNTPTPVPPTTNTPTPVPPTTNTTTPAPPTTNTPTPVPPTTNTTTPAPPTTNTPTPVPPTTNTTTPAPPTTNTTTPAPPTTNTTTPAPLTTNTTTPAPPTNNTTTPTATDTPTNTTTPAPPTTNTTTPAPPTTNTPTPAPPTTNTTTPAPPTTNTTTPAPPTTNTTTPTATDTPTSNTPTPTDTPAPPPPTTPPPPPPPPTTTTPAPPPPTTPPPTTTTTTPAPPPPTTPPPPPPTPTAALDCENGGEPKGTVCVCPDEWVGETCSVENFCRAQTLAGFNFPVTPTDWFAYSEEICPKGTSNAGKPQASARCSTQNGSLSLQSPPNVLQCDQTLSDIQQNLTSPAALESLAASTQILTSRPEELTSENVTAAAQIANTLLLSPNATESVRVAAVATVSQLLSANAEDDSEENNATLGLTLTLDQLSVNLSRAVNSSQSQVVQPNLVVQSAQVPAADTQGVQFTSLLGASGSFVANRIQLNTNTSAVVVENGFIADALMYVRFPPEATSLRQKPSNVSLGFVLYQNDRFFRSRRYKWRRATIRVLSGSVKGHEHSVMPQHVEMLFRQATPNRTTLFDFACVFWDYRLDDWSTDGCAKGNASDGLLRCFCNHTTNFAALFSFRHEHEYAEALDWLSIAGLSVSVLGLVMTITHHMKEHFHRTSRERQNNRKSTRALLCVCVSLLAFIITFLSGVGNTSRVNDAPVQISSPTNSIPEWDERVEPDRGSCSAVAALLHFFLLATFTWNSIYGTQLVLLVWAMHSSLPPYWTKLSHAVGWGVPAVVMAITLGATYRMDNPLGYRQEEFCWLAALDRDKHFDFGRPMFWAFALPVALILIYNVVLLVLTSVKMCRTDPHLRSSVNAGRLSLTKKILVSVSLAVLLGLSWTLGYLVLVTTGHAHQVFSILFCLSATTQGFQIFVLFTARSPTFRAAVSRLVRYISSAKLQPSNRKYRLWMSFGSPTSTESYRDLTDQQQTDTMTLQDLGDAAERH